MKERRGRRCCAETAARCSLQQELEGEQIVAPEICEGREDRAVNVARYLPEGERLCEPKELAVKAAKKESKGLKDGRSRQRRDFSQKSEEGRWPEGAAVSRFQMPSAAHTEGGGEVSWLSARRSKT